MHPDVVRAIENALAEDVGPGDLTSVLTVDENQRAVGRFFARQPMVVAGSELLERTMQPDSVDLYKRSGDRAETGDMIAQVTGPARRLLERERVSLNFMQRLSGVATLARRYSDAVAGTRTRILDTRKTTPGLRILEKMAAAAGGVKNHRMGLYDAILIKNNHVDLAGGVAKAVARAKASGLPVEIEVRDHAELEEALAQGVARVLLDNMTPKQAADEIRFIAGRAEVELSGGITLENIRKYAEAGADFISSGAITHSAQAVDINFRVSPL
ncbi:MAG: carboxylating nicotinate-nucleotide diphosphorylase [Bryobacteraceae bacterium]|nr:carboxylating nicotinate-nucleotide diphosphorylase [Bryobacteraceae bacterium]